MPVPEAIMAITVSSFERKAGVKQASAPAKRAETRSSDNPGAGRRGRAAASLDNEALLPPEASAFVRAGARESYTCAADERRARRSARRDGVLDSRAARTGRVIP